MPTSSNKNIDEIQQQLISSTTFLKDNFCLIQLLEGYVTRLKSDGQQQQKIENEAYS